MSPRHFSSHGGPYFINDGISKQHKGNKVSTIGMFKSFFLSRRKKEAPFSWPKDGCLPPHNK
jgi:hypothetical protein